MTSRYLGFIPKNCLCIPLVFSTSHYCTETGQVYKEKSYGSQSSMAYWWCLLHSDRLYVVTVSGWVLWWQLVSWQKSNYQTGRPGRFTPLERINQLFHEHHIDSFRASTQNDLLIILPTTWYVDGQGYSRWALGRQDPSNYSTSQPMFR